MKTLWGGRFERKIDDLAWDFNRSIDVDWRLAEVDIQGSVVWAKAITGAGILTPAELEKMLEGLQSVLVEVQSDTFVIKPTDEDVHTAIERRLTELIGPIGEKFTPAAAGMTRWRRILLMDHPGDRYPRQLYCRITAGIEK